MVVSRVKLKNKAAKISQQPPENHSETGGTRKQLKMAAGKKEKKQAFVSALRRLEGGDGQIAGNGSDRPAVAADIQSAAKNLVNKQNLKREGGRVKKAGQSGKASASSGSSAYAVPRNWHSSKLSLAKRESLVQNEVVELDRIAAHSAFQTDPLTALQMHIDAAVPKLNEHNSDFSKNTSALKNQNARRTAWAPKGPAHGRTQPRPE